jgi:TonB family protein
MATRCWCSDPRAWAFAITTALLGAACTHTTTRYYLPDPRNPRFTPAEASQTLTSYLKLQCEELRAAQVTSGDALLRVQSDGSGMVTQAEVTKSSGSDPLDRLIGTVVTQLRLDAPGLIARTRVQTVRVEYACTTGSERGTVQVPTS